MGKGRLGKGRQFAAATQFALNLDSMSNSSLHFAFVAEGDANTTDCWSGSAVSLVNELRAMGHRVDVIDVEVRGIARYLTALVSLRPSRESWRQQFILGDAAFRLRSAVARSVVKKQLDPKADIVIQLGASFDLGDFRHTGLHILLADGNAAMARLAGEFSDISLLPPTTQQRLIDRENAVYGRVDRFWTMSGYLARSFVNDFGVPPERVHVVYAGANRSQLEKLPPRMEYPVSPKILFVGRQYRRKGLGLLIAAFERTRKRYPSAELHVVGAPVSSAAGDGVTMHGSLDPNDPAQSSRLLQLYREASIFCLPSRYEPFGIAFVEAMLASIPCIGVRNWAMPEIIEDGTTGILVPDGDVDAIADALNRLISAPSLALQFGLAGRQRALSLFTWTRVAESILKDLNSIRS